jgi:hypothetical protein
LPSPSKSKTEAPVWREEASCEGFDQRMNGARSRRAAGLAVEVEHAEARVARHADLGEAVVVEVADDGRAAALSVIADEPASFIVLTSMTTWPVSVMIETSRHLGLGGHDLRDAVELLRRSRRPRWACRSRPRRTGVRDEVVDELLAQVWPS